MRDLMKYAKECMMELDNLNIEYGHITEFKINTRALNRWGQCKTLPGGFSININAILLDEKNNEQGLKNTIIHELLHSCKGCMNHGYKWNYYADKVNRTYGYNIKRTSSCDEKGLSEESQEKQKDIRTNKQQNRKQYEIICQKCGHKYIRYRVSKLTQHPECYVCSVCHGKLKVVA
jgi:predicted SprT family Zn-dependent metalloprotease